MDINEAKQIIDNTICQKDIDNDIDLNIISCYGGVQLGIIKISEVKNFVTNCVRGLNRDYFFEKY